MLERKLKSYFEHLERLSSTELHRSLEELVETERRNNAYVIVHLVEIRRRNLHLEFGYKSLFDYCVRELRLSEGSVWYRLQVAKVALRFPQVLEALVKGEISLSVAALLAPRLTGENVETLLADSARKTKREVETYLAGLAPKPQVTPGIRKRPRRPDEKREEKEKSGQDAPCSEMARSQPDLLGAAPVLQQSEAPQGEVEPAERDSYNFRFAAEKQFKEKLDRLAEVLGIEHPRRNIAKVLE